MRPRDADEVCASVSSEVMEEGGSHQGGEEGSTGPARSRGEGRKTQEMQKKKKRFKAS